MKISESLTGLIEIELFSDCSYSEFISTAEHIKQQLGIEYFDKIDNLESHYWDFKFRNLLYTIHYHALAGAYILLVEDKLTKQKQFEALNGLLEILQSEK